MNMTQCKQSKGRPRNKPLPCSNIDKLSNKSRASECSGLKVIVGPNLGLWRLGFKFRLLAFIRQCFCVSTASHPKSSKICLSIYPQPIITGCEWQVTSSSWSSSIQLDLRYSSLSFCAWMKRSIIPSSCVLRFGKCLQRTMSSSLTTVSKNTYDLSGMESSMPGATIIGLSSMPLKRVMLGWSSGC